ncbi:thioredoxin domain-containing protein [Flavobacterium antarcticum]|uniref:thioredoxin domain-containing protein n=1 Tax=Flavobacterium antarcticum TaxID=271155 RepID=UPI0003B6E43B|nr:thioredoxin domain-containing protein [Flavobacterium antarcticum]
MNELSIESSPYLLQHAENPVHWKAWNQKTITDALNKEQLIIVSIGYSACHWCHVMEHETFENDDAAKTMNAHFTSIKVDREERPDIDAVYMKAVQIMTQKGGWPLNVVCLPDGRPIWGGTYFKLDEWIDTLEQLQKLYDSKPEKLLEYADKLQEAISSLQHLPNEKTETPTEILLQELVAKWTKSFDHDFGGMARAPKFMMPNNYDFLQRYGFQNKDEELLKFVDLTLTKMAYGGLFDTIEGGFSRYSVDMKWHVPHFEKMLYDNGQLLSLYANAYKRTKNPLYQEVIEKTISFLQTNLDNKEGGFYSALDADSLTENQVLEEGAFYVWRKSELQSLIKDDFELFSTVFNINQFGHWEHGNYVLIQSESLEEIAKSFAISTSELHQKKKAWEQILFGERQKRSSPRLDDKCLTSWNALTITGLAESYKALQNPIYLELALKNGQFIAEKLWSPEGNLFRSYKNRKATINGFLEDYACVIQSFIALYEITLDEKWLNDAKQLTDYSLEHFYEPEQQLFNYTSNLDSALISKHYDIEDNVIASSNSMMAKNLRSLALHFSNSFYEKTAQEMLDKILPNIDYPSAFSNWLDLALDFGESKELAIIGTNALNEVQKLNSHYLPNILIAGSTKNSSLSLLANRFQQEKTLFYLCENKSCQAPTDNLESVLKSIL